MEHVSLARFGRREDFCTLRDRAAMLSRMAEGGLQPCADKWALFSRLRVARSHYGLTDRDLTVLNALLSCHPDRSLDPARSLVVFPSNATLSNRAHGMAESTLRRHLAALVRSGLILRRDSPNGKRYALRSATGQQAFGFDLRPLLSLRAEIEDRADALDAAAARLAGRRLALVLRLRDIAAVVMAMTDDPSGAGAGLAAIRTLLRRSTTVPLLDRVEGLLDDLAAALAPAMSAPETPDVETAESGASAAHSGRHIQDQHKDSFESKEARSPRAALTESSELAEKIDRSRPASGADAGVTLQQVKAACPEALGFSPIPVRDWQDMVRLADSLHPHLGVSPDLWARACQGFGRQAAAAVLCLLMERMERLRSLPAYLAGLLKRSRSVPLSLKALADWAGRGKLTAVNPVGSAACS